MRLKDVLEAVRRGICLIGSLAMISWEVAEAAMDGYNSKISRAAHFSGLAVGIGLAVVFKAADAENRTWIRKTA